jgi:TatD DNase family protein
VIDTHCHLDTPAFDADRAGVIERARTAGVSGILVPAIRPRTWPALLALVRASGGYLRAAIGIHPQVVPELGADELAGDLVARLCAHADACAVGECGLDGGTGAHELQERVFRAHVRAARTLGKPLVVHVLRAHDLAPRVLREENARDVGGILHAYSGGAALVPVYRDLGMAFSFAGPVTYPNARRPLEAARAVPADALLAETDAPDQAPAAHRGGRCEPAFLVDVLGGLASARGQDLPAVTALVTANARRILSWPA